MFRNMLVALLATSLLSGCAAVAVEGLVAEGVGAEGFLARGAIADGAAGGMADAGALAARGASMAPIAISADLEGLAVQRGVLSDWLSRFARDGGDAYLEPGGVLRANGQRLASIESDGLVIGRNGTRVGFLGSDGLLYEYTRGGASQSVGILEGFTTENGVRLTAKFNGTSGLEVLRPNVAVRVTGIGQGQYLIQLPNGATGWVPVSSLALMILAVGQQTAACPDSGSGTVVRSSGEKILFDACRTTDGALILDTADGRVIVDSRDVAMVLTGDRVSNTVLASNVSTPAFTEQPSETPSVQSPAFTEQQSTAEASSASSPFTESPDQ